MKVGGGRRCRKDGNLRSRCISCGARGGMNTREIIGKGNKMQRVRMRRGNMNSAMAPHIIGSPLLLLKKTWFLKSST